MTSGDDSPTTNDARFGAQVRHLSESPYVIWLTLAAITMVRNSLEMLGILTSSPNYCCFSPDRSSFLNTFTYELLLIFGGIYIVHLVLGGTGGQLRRLIAISVAFMVPLFIFVPLVNLVLNYHGPRIPIYLLDNIYLPMGSVLGFAAIAGLLPPLIRRVYPERGWPRTLLALGAGFLTMFLWTYVISFRLSFSAAGWLWEREANLMDVYSLTFIAPLLVTYPFFARSYGQPGRRRHVWVSYLLVLVTTGWLVHTSRVAASPTRLLEPVVCQQLLIPRTLPGMSAAQVRDHANGVARKARAGEADFSILREAAVRLGGGFQPPRLVFRRVPTGQGDNLQQAAFQLEPGQVSPVVESKLGLHILRRMGPPADKEVQHIMVARQHPRLGAVSSVQVQRLLVRRRTESLRVAVMNHPQSWAEIARKASDGPLATQGGRVPMDTVRLFRSLYDVVLGLEPGEVSRVVGSPWGLHIFRRLP